jgi:hypothetical protein
MLIKRTLTTLQITQFLVGASYAMLHSFVSYTVPITRTLANSTTETIFVPQPCTSTTGQTFAIWLNVLYLAPLTYLFVSFFIASYIRRTSNSSKTKVKTKGASRYDDVALNAEKAGWDAAKGVEREVYGDGSDSSSGEKSTKARSKNSKSPKSKTNGKASRK